MKKESPLWSSISLLIGIVIAILALVRGRMLLPLLLAVFALWLLWWLLTQALPLWRNNRAYRVKEAQLREQKAPANSGGQLADALLCHVNYRITAMLHAAYPNARWEWLDEPSRFAVEGGTARIRVYGIPEHDYADVKLDQKANLDCSLVKLSPLMPGSPDAQPPNRQPVNPRIWFETRGRAVLEALVTDLNSRGHSSLTVQENGEIFVQTKENETEPAKEAFLDFPEKVYWPQLVKVLESEGYAADARDADMSMEQNQLTRDLYAAGYTRENHPSFVYWSDWQNFGYLFEALLKFTWETPCGLLVDGKSDLGRDLACCDASFQGIDYCPENDNPLLRCPYERKDCPHSISGFPVPLCPCHTTGKRYSYEQSAERVESERSERQHRQYMEITGGAYCACVVGGNGYDGGHVEVQYDVEQCIRCRCQNPVCVIRKQKRDLSRANIFYDVRRTWITRIGFLEEKKVQVTKGERVFPHPVARTDAEIWLEMKKAHFNPLWSSSVIDSPHLTPADRRQTFFSKMHRRYGEYDYFEFHYDVENIRIAKSEQRDLLQDLRDVADGLEVVHAVDLKKEQAAKKRESRQRRREQKERRLNKPRSPAPPKEEQLTLLTEEEHFSNGDQTG